jgi:tetratricopeptide (TPR) repeat protein
MQDRRSQGRVLGNLGLAYFSLGDLSQAMACYKLGHTISREIGDRRREAIALSSLASAEISMGNSNRALDYIEQGLVVAQQIGDPLTKGDCLWTRALARKLTADNTTCIQDAQLAIALFEAANDPRAEVVRKKIEEWRT